MVRLLRLLVNRAVPIEASPVFAKPRPRLFHKVPVLETLRLVEMLRYEDRLHSKIEMFVKRMVKGAQAFFLKDIFDLECLKMGFDSGAFKMTKRGTVILRARLHSIYDDGVKYGLAAHLVREARIRHIVELESEIEESRMIASTAKNLSRIAGWKAGIEL